MMGMKVGGFLAGKKLNLAGFKDFCSRLRDVDSM
jgi:hypothetical protein